MFFRSIIFFILQFISYGPFCIVHSSTLIRVIKYNIKMFLIYCFLLERKKLSRQPNTKNFVFISVYLSPLQFSRISCRFTSRYTLRRKLSTVKCSSINPDCSERIRFRLVSNRRKVKFYRFGRGYDCKVSSHVAPIRTCY